LPAEPPLDDLLAFTASYTWRVSWQATSATLAGLGSCRQHLSTQLPVQVAEVQAINNG
jgi:hypothetical protein